MNDITNNIEPEHSLILPTGTRVVTRREVRTAAGELVCLAGAMGIVVKAPADSTHSYRVRLPSGAEVALQRHDLALFTRFQERGIQSGDEELDLYRYVIYRCIVGSRAYGLDEDGSDVDRRGIYLPPAEMHWSLGGVPEQLEKGQSEEVYWELQKFLTLALKANPNVLECLYTPLVETASPLAEELLSARGRFLSKLVYQTYNGYVISQFKKMEQDLRTRGEIRWKHAMHLIRLLLSGIMALKEEFVPVHVSEHRDRLLTVRRGEVQWEQVNEWRLELHAEFDEAYASTALPERPDYEWANQFLIKARRSTVSEDITTIVEQDYRSLATFRLAWRWTEPRYNVLPHHILADIRPLTEAKANGYDSYLRAGTRTEASGFMPEGYQLVEQINTAQGEGVGVHTWLAARVGNLAQRVVVLWNRGDAVVTRAGTFCEHWADFCYPASDDIDIIPLEGDWILVYWHEEVFFFGRRTNG